MAKHKKATKPARATSTPDADKRPKDKSPSVFQRDKIDYQLNIRERDDLTDKQKQLIELVMSKESKLIFVNGPAGTSKTFLAVYCALLLLNKHSVSDMLYVRSTAESGAKSLGYLPGDAAEKMNPFLAPLRDKLDEFLARAESDRLIKEERVVGTPINFLRGSSFNAKVIVADEAQNFERKELVTLITRLGKFSKMIVVGDKDQSDIGNRSGFGSMCDLFNDESSRAQGIHYFSFTKDDIVRSGILRYIVERLESAPVQ